MADEHDGAAGAPHHGSSAPRGLEPAGAGTFARGRFGRMFGFLPARGLSDAALTELLARIDESETDDNPRIPAGYTYLGQFIDHDITFDPTSQLQKVNDPYALADFRTPRLDLDSLYGSGPADQPFLYEWSAPDDRGVKLLVGRSPPGDPSGIADLPRNSQDRCWATPATTRTSSSLSCTCCSSAFTTRSSTTSASTPGAAASGGCAAQSCCTRRSGPCAGTTSGSSCTNFLPKIVGETVAASVLAGDAGAPVRRRLYRWRNEPFIPVEFSGAAFRFGHSMVRHGYRLASEAQDEIAVFVPGADPRGLDHLAGFRPLPPELQISWRLFFGLPGQPAPQPSLAIDSAIAFALRDLPPEVGESRSSRA